MSRILDAVSMKAREGPKGAALRDVPVGTGDYLIQPRIGSRRLFPIAFLCAVAFASATWTFFPRPARVPASIGTSSPVGSASEHPFRSGLRYFQQGRYDSAAEQFLKVPRDDEFFADALVSLGMVARRKNEPRIAREYLDRALAIQPANAVGLNNLGVLAEEQKDSARAILLFQAASSSNPDYPDPILNLGKTHEKRGEWSKAVEFYTRYLVHQQADQNLARSLRTRVQKLSALSRGPGKGARE